MIPYKGVTEVTVRNGLYYQGSCFSNESAFPKTEKLLRAILNTFEFT
jgi:hypothetical protein